MPRDYHDDERDYEAKKAEFDETWSPEEKIDHYNELLKQNAESVPSN